MGINFTGSWPLSVTTIIQLGAGVQPLVLGVILFWAGAWKTFHPRTGEVAIQSALKLIIIEEHTLHLFFRLLGVLELSIGLGLLLPPFQPLEVWLAISLTTSFVVYLTIVQYRAPDLSCGCLGGNIASASKYSLLRAGFLLIIALSGLTADQLWISVITADPRFLGLFTIEILGFVLLSPELKPARLLRRSHLESSFASPSQHDCSDMSIPLNETVHQLEKSAPYLALSKYLEPDILDYWREKCWRFLCYKASYQNHEATIVFAVPLLWRPDQIQAAVLEDDSDRVLLRVVS